MRMKLQIFWFLLGYPASLNFDIFSLFSADLENWYLFDRKRYHNRFRIMEPDKA